MPKELKILINPNPILRKKSIHISEKEILHPDFQSFLLDMAETMHKKDGAGLAAPQIGKNIRMVVIHHDDKTVFLINPEITYAEVDGCKKY